MITNKDIRMAINRQLKKADIKIMSRDVREGFSRPSFFVELDNVLREGNADQIYKSMTIRIYYFPSNEYEYAIEVLDMQEMLEDLFDLKLLVRDRLINVEEFTSFLNDGV